eukprot:403172-Amphidinium_carterae.1
MAGLPSLCRIIRRCPSDRSQSTNLSTAKVMIPSSSTACRTHYALLSLTPPRKSQAGPRRVLR